MSSEETTFTFYNPSYAYAPDYFTGPYSPVDVVNLGTFVYISLNIAGELTEQDVYNAWMQSYNAMGLLKVEIGTNVTSIGANTFNSDPTYNWGGMKGGSPLWVNTAFYGTYPNLVTVLFKEGGPNFTSIGENAFNMCYFLGRNSTGLTSPPITGYGQDAFDAPSYLNNGNIITPGNIQQPNYYINIPQTCESIGAGAFANCYPVDGNLGLEYLTTTSLNTASGAPGPAGFPPSLKTIGSNAFQGWNFQTWYANPGTGSAAAPVYINAETISDSAFQGVSNMNPLTFGPNVQTIGANAFASCSGLQIVEIPDNVTSLGANAFKDCKDLYKLKMGSGITTIPEGAFQGCTGLGNVWSDENTGTTQYMIGENVTTIGENAFNGCGAIALETQDRTGVPLFIPNSVTSIAAGSGVDSTGPPGAFAGSGLGTFATADGSGPTPWGITVTPNNSLGINTPSGNNVIGGAGTRTPNDGNVVIISISPTNTVPSSSTATQGKEHSVAFTVTGLKDVKAELVDKTKGTLTEFTSNQPARSSNQTTNINNIKTVTKTYIHRWTPFNIDVGSNPIQFKFTDGHGATDTVTHTITVANVNDAPVFVSRPLTVARQESLYSYTVTINDIDVGDIVTVTATTKPNWLSFDGTTLSGTPSRSVWGEYKVELTATDLLGAKAIQSFTIMVRKPVCFNEGTKILCLKNGEEQYVAVEKLCEGDEVKTLNHGYKKIADMRKGSFKLNGLRDMGMYKMKKQGNMIADLEMSGLHSVLVDANDAKYADDIKRQRGLNNKKFYIDGKFRLRANESHEFQQMEQKEYTIYSFALEEQQEQYGIWANGVLVETTKRKNLEVSNMEKVKKLVKGKNQ